MKKILPLLTLLLLCAMSTNGQEFDYEIISITPLDRSEVESLKEFTLNTAGQTVTLADTPSVTLTENGNAVTDGSVRLDGTDKVIVTLHQEITTPGNYQLNIQNALLFNGTVLNPLSFKYSVAGMADFTVNPAPGKVVNLSTFTVTFNNYMVELSENAKATLVNKGTQEEVAASLYEIGGGTALYVALTEDVSADGKWQLRIEGVKNMLTDEKMQLAFEYTIGEAPSGDSSQTSWWGFTTADDEIGSLGVQEADTYHAAIYLTSLNNVTRNKTLKGLRFAILSQNATDICVWVASQLPSSLTDTHILTKQAVSSSAIGAGGIVEVTLDSPIAIPAEGAYVGFSFTIPQVISAGDAYPIGLASGLSDLYNSLIIKADKSVPNWQDLYGQQFGRLYLQLLLEGTFMQNAASPMDLSTYYAKTGATTTANITLTSEGTAAISDIDYTLADSEGNHGAEQHYTLPAPIPAFHSATIAVTIPSDPVQGKNAREHEVRITKVNGQPNETPTQYTHYALFTLDRFIDRNVCIEEYTGLTCGWCVRGIVGMEKMRHTFGDRFVGIALHQYSNASGDAMNIAKTAYAKHSMNGAPSCTMDRKFITDPYYGEGYDIIDDFRLEMDIPAMADISLQANWNADSTKVDATATVEALFDSDYNIEFVLLADSVEGTGTGWNQSNYYPSYYTSSQLPADLAIYGKGGSRGTSTISGLKFNDVAVSSSYTASQNKAVLPQLTAEEPATSSFSLSLPTRVTLRNALKKHCMYAAALLVDADGTIVNCVKAPVEAFNASLGVTAPHTAANGRQTRYSLDGRRLTAPQRGLNIIRMADGTTRKVMVK